MLLYALIKIEKIMTNKIDLSTEASSKVGSFFKDGKWNNLQITRRDGNREILPTTKNYPMPSQNINDIVEDVMLTLKTDPEFAAKEELQSILSDDKRWSISFKKDCITVIDKKNPKARWDVSTASLRHKNESGSLVEQPRTCWGLFTKKVVDLSPDLFNAVNGTSIENVVSSHDKTMPLSTHKIPAVNPKNLDLSYLKDWSNGKSLDSLPLIQHTEAFKKRLREDFEPYGQKLDKLLPLLQTPNKPQAEKLLKQLLTPLENKTSELKEQHKTEKDPYKKKQLQERLDKLKALLEKPLESKDAFINAFVETEVQKFVQEHLRKYPDTKSPFKDHEKARLLCNELLENDCLKNYIIKNFTDILIPAKNESWTRFLTLQNAAWAALTIGAVYFLPPMTALVAFQAGYLAYKNIEEIDSTLLAQSTKESPDIYRNLPSTFRKMAIPTAVGLASTFLAPFVAPTTLLSALFVGEKIYEYSDTITPLLQKIPQVTQNPKEGVLVAKIALGALGTAISAGLIPGGFIFTSGLVTGGLGYFFRNELATIAKQVLPEQITQPLDDETTKAILMPLIGALLPIAAGFLIPPIASRYFLSYSPIHLLLKDVIPAMGTAGTIFQTIFFPTFLPTALSAYDLIKNQFSKKLSDNTQMTLAAAASIGIAAAISFASPYLFGGVLSASKHLSLQSLSLLWNCTAGMVIPGGFGPLGLGKKLLFAYAMLMGKHAIKHGSCWLKNNGYPYVPALSEKMSYLLLTAIAWGALYNFRFAGISTAYSALEYVAGSTLCKIALTGTIYKILDSAKSPRWAKITSLAVGAFFSFPSAIASSYSFGVKLFVSIPSFLLSNKATLFTLGAALHTLATTEGDATRKLTATVWSVAKNIFYLPYGMLWDLGSEVYSKKGSWRKKLLNRNLLTPIAKGAFFHYHTAFSMLWSSIVSSCYVGKDLLLSAPSFVWNYPATLWTLGSAIYTLRASQGTKVKKAAVIVWSAVKNFFYFPYGMVWDLGAEVYEKRGSLREKLLNRNHLKPIAKAAIFNSQYLFEIIWASVLPKVISVGDQVLDKMHIVKPLARKIVATASLIKSTAEATIYYSKEFYGMAQDTTSKVIALADRVLDKMYVKPIARTIGDIYRFIVN
jgi:hypothetical protein